MELLPILIAGVAAGAILLIFLGLTSRSSVDPVQARLTQLGAMQAKNLEELELQQPFIERTLRPLADRGLRPDVADGQLVVPGADREAARARRQSRQPPRGRLARRQGRRRGRRGDPVLHLLFVVVGFMGCRPFLRFLMPVIGLLFGYTIPEFWLGSQVRKRQHAILLQIPDALDLLTISVRAGLGFDAALGKVVEKLKAR